MEDSAILAIDKPAIKKLEKDGFIEVSKYSIKISD
jgi:hypothetical protein